MGLGLCGYQPFLSFLKMFAIVISEHRLWGYRFQPCILADESQSETLSCLRLGGDDFPLEGLSERETKIVRLCSKYSEQFVMRIFVKEKMSVSEFQNKFLLNKNAYPQVIPFIEKNNYAVAELLLGSDIPVYLREKNFSGVYKSDRVKVLPSLARPVPSFDLGPEKLSYSLKVFSGSEEVHFRSFRKKNIVLSSEPCCLVCAKQLCIFESMNYKRLLPFTDKEGVDVQLRTVPSYMKSFVLPTLEKEDVDAHGFVVEHRNIVPRPILALMEDLSLRTAISLSFDYDGSSFPLDSPKKRFVSLSGADDFKFSVFERDGALEKHYASKLIEMGLVPVNSCYYVSERNEMDRSRSLYDTVDFLVKHKHELSEFKIVQKLDVPEFVLEAPSLLFDVKDDNSHDWFDIHAVVRVGDVSFPFAFLRQNIIDGDREYRLPSGQVFIIPEAWFAQYADFFLYAEIQDPDSEILNLRKCYVGMFESNVQEPVRRFRGLLEKKLDVPVNLNAQLRDYQHVGYSWIVGLYENGFGGCLADDMGLGKTLQFLAFFLKVYSSDSKDVVTSENAQPAGSPWPYESAQPSLFDQPLYEVPVSPQSAEPRAKRKSASLVVLPTSLLFNWVNEKNKFAPSLSHLMYVGGKRVSSDALCRTFDRYNLVFTTYGLLRRDIDSLKNYHFECVVMDESQYVKNASSQAYKAAMKLDAKHFFCMSGTPIENSLEDLWAQMNMANHGLLGSAESFRKVYVTPIVKHGNEDRTDKLKMLIKPFLLRRTKEEVAKDLPPVVEQVVYCDLNEEHKDLYEREKSMVRNSLMSMISESGINKNSILALSSLTRLRELSNHPRLVFDDSLVESEKMDEVVRRIHNLKAEGHKVLVFSSFVRHLELLREHLDKEDVPYVMLTGETQHRDREVAKFQNDPSVVCFLISLKAGGVGLNLMAADYVFILDPWWNPAAEMQAVDRAHRIGQDKTVFVYRFISKDTVEEKIRVMQAEKSQLSDMFVNSNNPFADVDLEMINRLFS